MIRTTGLTLLLAVCLATAAAPAAPATGTLIPFRLKDQHDRLLTDARFGHAALLVLWGDRKGSEAMDAWAPLLADSLAAPVDAYRLRLLQVAHGQGAPFFVKGKIKRKFAAPGRGPVLMDWDGIFARAYGCAPDSCTVLLFGADGRLRARWTEAAPDSAAVARVLAAARSAAADDGAATDPAAAPSPVR